MKIGFYQFAPVQIDKTEAWHLSDFDYLLNNHDDKIRGAIASNGSETGCVFV